MSGQGYHFALDPPRAAELLALRGESEVSDWMNELYEGWTDAANVHGGYKEWDVLHRCLSDGTFDPKGGTAPWNRCFFGGRLLVSRGQTINLVTPAEVREVAGAMDAIDEAGFRERYDRLLAPITDREAHHRWFPHFFELFDALRAFYAQAADQGKAIVFYSDDGLDMFVGREAPPP